MKLLAKLEQAGTTMKWLYGIAGIVLVILLWTLLTYGAEPIVTSGILPSPIRVFWAFGELFQQNALLRNMGLSIGLNLSGYLEAILITIPVGFIIGLMKFPRFAFKIQVDAIRYIPLTAVTGLFIVWFGIDTDMKVHFLAFGILIYLLPVMVQRIDEVDDVYLKTAHTLGATDWQTIKTIYIPNVLSRLSDDLRVLTAISWTYIIVVEGINSNQGGLGALIYNVGQRQGRLDKMFALLIIIILIGVIQDRLFVRLDKSLFPHKYQAIESFQASRIRKESLVQVIFKYAVSALGWSVAAIYFLLMLVEFIPLTGGFRPLSYFFGNTTWVMHVLYMGILYISLSNWYRHRTDQIALQQAGVKTHDV